MEHGSPCARCHNILTFRLPNPGRPAPGIWCLGMAKSLKSLEVEIEGDFDGGRGLHEIDKAITSELDPRRVLEVLLERTSHLVPSIAASTVRLLNEETGELEPVACHNLDEKEWKAATAEGNGVLGKILAEEDAVVMVRNVHEDPRTVAREFLRKHGLVGYLRVPLTAKGKTLGVLTFFTRQAQGFNEAEVQLLTTFGDQGAIAIENSLLYQQTKKQAIELEQRNAELVKAISVREEFLSLISHELRTPLTVVMGYAQMVNDGVFGELNAKQEDAIRKIVTQSKGQLDMINNILTATALESGKVVVNKRVVMLPELLNEVLAIYYELSVKKGIKVLLDFPADFPILETDAAKLKHILQTLIGNALKFTEEGTVSCALMHIPEAKRIEIKVTDTGIGIPEGQQSLIFSKFRQADGSDARSYGGVGLGLYITKQFTQLLEGEITLQSEPGKGSTFTVALPARPTY